MAIQNPREMNGMEKASILLVALGREISTEVFKHLSEPEIERLSAQMIKMKEIDPSMIEFVVSEFESVKNLAYSGIISGKDFASDVLEQVIGAEAAGQLIKNASKGPVRPFEALWELEPGEAAQLLEHEQAQVIGVVLTFLPPEKAATILGEFSESLQSEVAYRICTMEQINSEIVKDIEEALSTKMQSSGASQIVASGGPKALVEILNRSERTTERIVLDGLGNEDPEVQEQVRGMMFVFEDLPKLEDRTVQLVLREVEQEDLRLALKSADEDIQELVFRNMSERAADMLKEDLELVGSVKQKDAETAQQKVVSVVRRLLLSGEAVLRSTEEEQDIEQCDQVELSA